MLSQPHLHRGSGQVACSDSGDLLCNGPGSPAFLSPCWKLPRCLQIAALLQQNAALEAKVSDLSTAEGPGFGLQALGAVPKFTCKSCK